MAGLTTIVGNAIRQRLIQDQVLQSRVTETINGVSYIKIYQDLADPRVHSPWIIMKHLYGGEDNKAPSEAFDVTWQVFAVSTSRSDSESLADLIHDNLKHSTLAYVDWYDWAGVTTIGPYVAPETVSNIQYWKIGSYFHLRASRS